MNYFISNITLHNKTTNQVIMLDEAYYVAISDNSTLTFGLEEEIPNGEYDAISFVLGLNDADNTQGRFPNPPQNAME